MPSESFEAGNGMFLQPTARLHGKDWRQVDWLQQVEGNGMIKEFQSEIGCGKQTKL